jgi:hypothetical protein
MFRDLNDSSLLFESACFLSCPVVVPQFGDRHTAYYLSTRLQEIPELYSRVFDKFFRSIVSPGADPETISLRYLAAHPIAY